jgi:hypothetical protein
MQLWHAAKIAGCVTRVDRVQWAVKEYCKAHPEASRKQIYLTLEFETRGYGC